MSLDLYIGVGICFLFDLMYTEMMLVQILTNLMPLFFLPRSVSSLIVGNKMFRPSLAAD